MGHHHLVIHPRFGNFIVLGAILFGKGKESFGALRRRKIRIKGSPRLMKEFARCFPS